MELETRKEAMEQLEEEQKGPLDSALDTTKAVFSDAADSTKEMVQDTYCNVTGGTTTKNKIACKAKGAIDWSAEKLENARDHISDFGDRVKHSMD